MADITADVSLVGALEIETDVRGVRGESAYAIAVRNGFVGTESEWLASLKGDPGTPGQDGHSPVITATKSGGTTTVKVDGTTVATIADGADGHSPVISATKSSKITTITADGTVIATINDGQDGHSPVITTSKSGKTTTILADGTSIGTVLDGEDGQDGTTPSFSIGTVQDGQTAAATITGTDANPVLNLTLPKGEDGQAGQGIPTGGTAGQVLKKSSGTDYDAEWADESGAVTDVQINGASVLSNGVANIPVASTNAYGVLLTERDEDAKSGLSTIRAVTSARQEKSVFYGLAKASGDTTQSQSSNAVGVYTDSAKVAIQKMLGIYEAPWELIREDTGTNETSQDIEITVDSNGEPLSLTDIRIIFTTPKQDTDAVIGNYGRIRCFYTNSLNDVVYIGAYTQDAQAGARTSAVQILQKDGMIERSYYKNYTENGEKSPVSMMVYGTGNTGIWELNTKEYQKITIEAITGSWKYKLYGKRKWN